MNEALKERPSGFKKERGQRERESRSLKTPELLAKLFEGTPITVIAEWPPRSRLTCEPIT